MSKLKLDKINFEEKELLVEIKFENENFQDAQNAIQEVDFEMQKKEQEIEQEAKKIIDDATLILNRARDEAQKIMENAQKEVQELKDKIEEELQTIEPQKKEILEQAKLEAQNILEQAKDEAQNETNVLLENLRQDIEQERIETIKNAYEEGHKDGLEKVYEELDEKINNFDKFCANQYEIREKILKSANKDILDLILTITKKILQKEVDAQSIDKIIKSTVLMLEKKENINIILSEKYAKLLFEHQKKFVDTDIEFKFEDFVIENYDPWPVIKGAIAV